MRDSLQWFLTSAGLQCRLYSTAQELLQTLNHEAHGCLVLDLRLPGMGGLELHDELRARRMDLPTIMITGHGDVPLAVRAMKSGVIDFLEKPFRNDELLQRINEALHDDEGRRRDRIERGQILARLWSLSPREREVLDLIVQGYSNRTSGRELGVSHKTIEVHRANVMAPAT